MLKKANIRRRLCGTRSQKFRNIQRKHCEVFLHINFLQKFCICYT